jgi:hypothetical protein
VWCPGLNKRIALLAFLHGCRKRLLKDFTHIWDELRSDGDGLTTCHVCSISHIQSLLSTEITCRRGGKSNPLESRRKLIQIKRKVGRDFFTYVKTLLIILGKTNCLFSTQLISQKVYVLRLKSNMAPTLNHTLIELNTILEYAYWLVCWLYYRKWVGTCDSFGVNSWFIYRLNHRFSINIPTKRGKEKSPSDGHCQCQKEMDDHLAINSHLATS